MTRDEVMRADQSDGGMFAVIPSVVMQDPGLSMSARMLYGIITWRCNRKAYCWASNRTLADDLGLSPKRVSALVSDLELHGHIETEIIKDTETGEVKYRYIYPVVKSSRGMVHPIPKNEDTPPQEQGYPSPNSGGPIPENEEDIYEKYKKKHKMNEKEPPKAPQGAAVSERPKRRRKPKAVPTWQPEKFEGFWSAYPRDEDRAKAVEQWDRLPQDKDLMARYGGSEEQLLRDMSVGLRRHLESRQWQEDVGIPYAFRWLRDRKWTEKKKRPAESTQPPSALPVPAGPRRSHTEIINGEEVIVYDE